MCRKELEGISKSAVEDRRMVEFCCGGRDGGWMGGLLCEVLFSSAVAW